MVPGTEGHGPKLHEDGPEKWEGDGQLGRCRPKAMGALDATNRSFQPAVGESIEVEAEIDVPRSQGIELVLDAVEGAGPSQVADPFDEE